MTKTTYTITRPEDDPGPGVLIATGIGRSLRMERGSSHEVTLNPESEADALFLRNMAERYQVTENPAPKKKRTRGQSSETNTEREE